MLGKSKMSSTILLMSIRYFGRTKIDYVSLGCKARVWFGVLVMRGCGLSVALERVGMVI